MSKTISRPVPKARPPRVKPAPARIHANSSTVAHPLNDSQEKASESEQPLPANQLSISLPPLGFTDLATVLSEAFDQAAFGKGVARHGLGQPFAQQPMQQLIRINGLGFATGQAGKKASEALRMLASPNASPEAAVDELLGSIVYLAGAVLAIRSDVARPPAERVLTLV
jgi:hypothetical protein